VAGGTGLFAGLGLYASADREVAEGIEEELVPPSLCCCARYSWNNWIFGDIRGKFFVVSNLTAPISSYSSKYYM